MVDRDGGEREEGVEKDGKEVRVESEEATAMVALLPLESLEKGLRGLAVEGEEREAATCEVAVDGKMEEEEVEEVEEWVSVGSWKGGEEREAILLPEENMVHLGELFVKYKEVESKN